MSLIEKQANIAALIAAAGHCLCKSVANGDESKNFPEHMVSVNADIMAYSPG